MGYYDDAWRIDVSEPGRSYFRDNRRKESLRYRRGDGRGGFGGRGEGKRFFERGKFKYALLELLAAEPMHGYQLIKTMEEKTGGLYSPSPGSVYPNLQWLEKMQLIGSSDQEGKKLYHITDAGRAFLREQAVEQQERRQQEQQELFAGRHRHRSHESKDGRNDKYALRGLMKEWAEVILLMADAAKIARNHPSSQQAKQFHSLMNSLRHELLKITASDKEN